MCNQQQNQLPSNTIETIPIIVFYHETPPEYDCELITYIDKPPNYQKPVIIATKIDNKKCDNKKCDKGKGKCCYSKESDDSRCCGACYWICPTGIIENQCNFCPNDFCEFWKSGYIQTSEGSVRNNDSCDECECDDCFCTTVCFPLKITIFFPCFLGSLFNQCMNKVCASNRNYLF
jgi:hypothetical protein